MNEVPRILGEIVGELRRMENKIKGVWPSGRPKMEAGLTGLPTRLSDLAADGSCAMQYLFGYLFKGVGALECLGGLIMIAIALTHLTQGWDLQALSVGLFLVATAQLFWFAGHLLHRSADRRRYANDQNRLLRLARNKGGSLTVLEAATDGRMTVDTAEEILRELAARGHAEVRVSDSGLLVYRITEIERIEEKDQARPMDEL